jgi:hypothetical protein
MEGRKLKENAKALQHLKLKKFYKCIIIMNSLWERFINFINYSYIVQREVELTMFHYKLFSFIKYFYVVWSVAIFVVSSNKVKIH